MPLFSRSELLTAVAALDRAEKALFDGQWKQELHPAIDYQKDRTICLHVALQAGCDSYTVHLAVLFYVRQAIRNTGFQGTIVQFNDAPGRSRKQIADVLVEAKQSAQADLERALRSAMARRGQGL